MNKIKKYSIEGKAVQEFHNQVDFCIGTGRMGLALQKEYQEQLKLVQEEIGFRYIRGHGLFCDDMAIYQEHTDEQGNLFVEYNFTYLDLVMDSYQKLNIKPFLELGFMPEKMASDSQTVFYWKGNVTPPKKYEDWCKLVQATLEHLLERYGVEEVITWPIEVWNEPNLTVFWKDADQEEYFRLFSNTFYAIKEVNERFLVGGPAVCGGSDEVWIRAFLTYCSEHKIPVDFVTRHHYTTDFPETVGHYGYAELSPPEDGFDNLKTTRAIIDSFPEYKGLQIHITEFNTSYIPNCPLHDTNQNAAYIAQQLSRLGDDNESYSYWTFGDIFEERGVPFTPFHGGFGLVANGGIPKPTFFTFQFFKQLKGTCVHRSQEAIIMEDEKGNYCGIAWNYPGQGNRGDLELGLTLPVKTGTSNYVLLKKTVDPDTCNPLKLWHDLGEPSSLTQRQKKILLEGAKPFVETKQLESKENHLDVSFLVRENGVIYFELEIIERKSDRGYSYERVMEMYS